MSDVQVIQVIRTRLLRKGDGASEDSPIRIIEQFWDMEGNLLWQVDPLIGKTSAQ